MAEVTFGLIGPLDVRCAGRSIRVPAARQRSLLAALLLRANQPVSKRSLCAAVWGERPPDQAETTLRSYVMRLRQVLGPVPAARLSVQPPGYQLRLDQDDEFDLLRLQGCIRRGRSAARQEDWDGSIREFRAGLALWRGEPLCDVPSDQLHLSVIPALAELRAQLWEGLYAAARQQGRAADLVVPLQRLTEEDPLSERFSALFMSALANCNRRVDALAEFRRLRRTLVGEQGMEPGASLQELHQRLLRDECRPAAPVPHARQAPVMTAPVPVPRQLPRGAAAFAGRAREVGELVDCLSVAPEANVAHPVVAITGFPGIGKSELAITVAHRLADRYPDGQLYADLRGTVAAPAAPATVAARFLRALGVDRRALARGEAERIAQYRSLLAGRRVLLVLDDALDADQVRPLIPGSPCCGTLVTARRGLAQLPEARLTTLAELPDEDARELIAAIAGRERAAREPAAVSSIVAACGGVPLALQIAGARLAARPAWPLGHFARLLADESRRLDELCYGPLSLRARLAAAYHALAPGPEEPEEREGREGAARATGAACAFRRLGQWPSASITIQQAAAAFGQPVPEVAAALETLADANLLASPAPGVYQLHPLARIFAAECAACPASA